MRQPDESRYVPALGFHGLTTYYDAVAGIATRERAFKQALIRQASIDPGDRVLDLACGTGTLSIWIKKAHPQADLVGVDGDPAVLTLAVRKAKEAAVAVQFDEGMSYGLSYPDSHFDRVVSTLFFHHLSWDDKERTVQEIYRVLRPGGQLHVADWGKSTNLFMRLMFLPVQCLDGFKNTQDNVSGNLAALFQHAGFDQVLQRQAFSTMFGTLALYSAVKPG